MYVIKCVAAVRSELVEGFIAGSSGWLVGLVRATTDEV